MLSVWIPLGMISPSLEMMFSHWSPVLCSSWTGFAWHTQSKTRGGSTLESVWLRKHCPDCGCVWEHLQLTSLSAGCDGVVRLFRSSLSFAWSLFLCGGHQWYDVIIRGSSCIICCYQCSCCFAPCFSWPPVPWEMSNCDAGIKNKH